MYDMHYGEELYNLLHTNTTHEFYKQTLLYIFFLNYFFIYYILYIRSIKIKNSEKDGFICFIY